MATSNAVRESNQIELFIVDVDGTLLTSDKVLTYRARRAAHALRDAGVRLALTSGRPPRGLEMLVEPLALSTPLAAFNGGTFVDPDLSIVERHPVDPAAARSVARLVEDLGVDLWVYSDLEWYVRRRDAPHVEHERRAVGFEPKTTDDLFELLDDASKVVGVSDDEATMSRCEREVLALGARVHAVRSQPYYLDITHPKANKGEVVRRFARMFSVDPSHVAAIGDMPNDVDMFQVAALSIAMGNADARVRRHADCVTASNAENGFAKAVDELILPRAWHGAGR